MKTKRSKKRHWIILMTVAAIAIATIGLTRPWAGPAAESTSTFFVIAKRDLDITVLESGSVKALKKLEIKSEVEGNTTILSLIPEGIYLTEEDVANRRVLVELDSSSIRDKITQQEITLQSAQASYTQAKESYDIQVNQNESNIKTGELDVKFSRMDFDKYLGAELAREMIESPSSFDSLQSDERLDGESLQKLRKLDSNIDLATEEVGRAIDKVEWTRKLCDNKYVTRNELEADKLALKRKQVELEQARTELKIFEQYDFPKDVEQRLADYHEANKALERIKARARSELATSEAQLKSKEAAHRLQKERYDRLKEQLDASVIYATQPGLVVYATSGNPWRRQPPLEEGASVRERQVIINIPDTSQMAVEIKLHEASIDKVKLDQEARITLDAYPDIQLEGHVQKVAVLPDAQHRWLNPDLKVYSTNIVIHGEHKVLKPGLSARVEVIIDKLGDVLVAPIQTVVPEGDERVCYVVTNGGTERRVVEAGLANDKFIEIKSGLSVGEKVMLNPPRYAGVAEDVDAQQPDAEDRDQGEGESKQQTGEEADTKKPEEQAGPAAAGDMMQQWQNMSSEEREKRMEEFRKLSPEQQRKMLERLGKMGINPDARRRGAGGGRPPGGRSRRGAE